jgi:UDP-N-acetylglucosamine--N-acetylmuramyl-(pentapeptide) pyrophosphoryl-undecaprenol N-acetylglucosamine transferase
MKILFAAGGTGGHINPAIATAQRIREAHPDAQILFIGTPDHMEARLVPAAGFDFKTIKISGFYRKPTLKNICRNIRTFFRLFTSASRSRKIIRVFAPDVAVGFGGYVSGPVLREAHKLGVKTAVHEQNAFPGMTNKILAKNADAVMVSTKAAVPYFEDCITPVVTGLPVREAMTGADRSSCRAKLGIPPNVPFILSMGGSLGADAVNKAVCELIALKKDDKDCIFMHAYGQYGDWVPGRLEKLGVDLKDRKDIILRSYIDDMEVCMPAADIVICRAGASSISEIEALGKASVLIPSPNVAENHQYHNAKDLADNKAALIIEEKNLTGEKLRDMVDMLIRNHAQRMNMETNAKSMSVPDAGEQICSIIYGLCGNTGRGESD